MSTPKLTLMTNYGGAEFSVTHTDRHSITIYFREYVRGGSIWTKLSKEDARAMARILEQASREGET